MFRFTIRDVLWLTVVVALAVLAIQGVLSRRELEFQYKEEKQHSMGVEEENKLLKHQLKQLSKFGVIGQQISN